MTGHDSPIDSDQEYFEALYRQYYGAIMRFAARRTDEQSARDITAETFLIAWRRLGVIPRSNVLPWLYATAHNVLRHEQRGRTRRARLDEQLRSQPPGVNMDVADAVVNRLQAWLLLEALASKEREAIQLVEWERLEIGEAATVVGCSAATFRVRLHRARRRLVGANTSSPAITEETLL